MLKEGILYLFFLSTMYPAEDHSKQKKYNGPIPRFTRVNFVLKTMFKL
jgi:hypothetical protein